MKRLAIFVSLAVLALGLLGVSSAATVPLAGSLDPTFGDGGSVVATNSMEVAGIAVQPNGKIVVAGMTSGGSEFWLARYLPDGSPDPSFGDGGEVETQVGGWGVQAQSRCNPTGRSSLPEAAPREPTTFPRFSRSTRSPATTRTAPWTRVSEPTGSRTRSSPSRRRATVAPSL